MHIRVSSIVIPLLVIAIAVIGSRLTASGMAWYRTIALPTWTPPGWVISTAWTIIFILSAWAMIQVWNNFPREDRFWWIVGIAALNGLLNVGWSFLFFNQGLIGAALAEMVILFLTVAALIFLLLPRLPFAAALFVPYGLWVAFATILTVEIYRLNA